MGDVAKLTRGGGSDGGSCTHSDDAEGFDVVVWEADGLVDGRLGYGAPIAMRLAAAGLAARVVPLTERVPTDGELAAPVHIVSGGSTSVDADAAWLVAARDRLAVVLDRALEGAATLSGICFGSQLIAHVFAGPDCVGVHPDGMQAGLVPVREVAGSAEPDDVVSSFHYHSIERRVLEAAGGRVVLESDRTPVQAYEIGSAVRGMQFHPEFSPRQLRRALRNHRGVVEKYGASMSSVNRSIVELGARWDPSRWQSALAWLASECDGAGLRNAS